MLQNKNRRPYLFSFVYLVLVSKVLAFGCSSTNQITPTSKPTQTLYPTLLLVSKTIIPSSTATETSPLSSVSPSPDFKICSPLEGIPLFKITEQITNKFSPPAPGSDDPHQGIDFSIIDQNTGYAVSSNPVKAALSGSIATIILNRFPYGNGVIIETTFDSLPESYFGRNLIPTSAPVEINHSNLSCPQSETSILINEVSQADPISQYDRSIYLLYAHLDTLEAFQPGQNIQCGQRLGTIGNSGNALNPHLHIEARIGPRAVRLDSLAHYDSSASLQEMASYCIWRISGMFQLIDPMTLLVTDPQIE